MEHTYIPVDFMEKGNFYVQEFRYNGKEARVIFKYEGRKSSPLIDASDKFSKVRKSKTDISSKDRLRYATEEEKTWLLACIEAGKSVPEPKDEIINSYSIF